MIVNSPAVQDSLNALDKKHIFVTVLALKDLCVHPMILMNKVFKEQRELEESKAIESSDEDF